MKRFIKMSPVAQQALWTKTTAGTHTPTQFLIDGDAESGYEILHVDSELCGFTIIRVRTLYVAKQICQQINENGRSDWDKHMTVGTYAWKHHVNPELAK